LDYESVAEYAENLVGEGGRSFVRAFNKSLEMQPYGVVSIDPSRGRLLELISRIKSPKRILEIGPGVGYSALWFLRGARRTIRLEVIEVNHHVASEFQKTIRQTSHGVVIIHHGPALQVLPKLRGCFDIIFLDADKNEYPAYLQYAMRLTRPGSIIIADNLLWHGSVVSGRREGIDVILNYTKRIFNDKRLCSLMIPLGDGVGVSLRVK
jgi:predicted O-methyltransferase YrrM